MLTRIKRLLRDRCGTNRIVAPTKAPPAPPPTPGIGLGEIGRKP